MRRQRLSLLLISTMLLLAAGCAEVEEPSEPNADGPLTVAVIPKATMHVFWKSIHAGARKAERELPGVKIIWQGPAVEDDRGAQIALVETFIQKRVDGIVLAPLDDKALIAPVRAAGRAGVPVVIIDSALADPDAYVSFVATDNYKGGVLGAKRVADLLGEKGGKVILLRYQVGSASTENRERGFLDEIKKHPAIDIVSSDQYAGATVETERLRHAAGPDGRWPGRQDQVRWLRRLRTPRRGHDRRAHPRARCPEPRAHGTRRRDHHGRPPARQDRAQTR